jgi:hypothetical protein
MALAFGRLKIQRYVHAIVSQIALSICVAGREGPKGEPGAARSQAICLIGQCSLKSQIERRKAIEVKSRS